MEDPQALIQPVFYFEPGNPPEVALVAGNHLESSRQGDRRYAHVGVTYGSSALLQLRPEFSVAPGRGGVERENGQVGQKGVFDPLEQSGGALSFPVCPPYKHPQGNARGGIMLWGGPDH